MKGPKRQLDSETGTTDEAQFKKLKKSKLVIKKEDVIEKKDDKAKLIKPLRKKKKKNLLNDSKQTVTEKNDGNLIQLLKNKKINKKLNNGKQDGTKMNGDKAITLLKKKTNLKVRKQNGTEKKVDEATNCLKKKILLNDRKKKEQPIADNSEEKINTANTEVSRQSEENTKDDVCRKQNFKKEKLKQMKKPKTENILPDNGKTKTKDKLKKKTKANSVSHVDAKPDTNENLEVETEEVKYVASEEDELLYILLGDRPEKIATLNTSQKRLIKLSLVDGDDMGMENSELRRKNVIEMKQKHMITYNEAVDRGHKTGALMNTIDRRSRSTKFEDSD